MKPVNPMDSVRRYHVTCTVCGQAGSLNYGKLAAIPIQIHRWWKAFMKQHQLFPSYQMKRINKIESYVRSCISYIICSGHPVGFVAKLRNHHQYYCQIATFTYGNFNELSMLLYEFIIP